MDDLITSTGSKRGGALSLQLTGVILALMHLSVNSYFSYYFSLVLSTMVSTHIHLPITPLSLSIYSAI